MLCVTLRNALLTSLSSAQVEPTTYSRLNSPIYARFNAYACSVNLLTSFTASELDGVESDAYNFYLSQLRIRIEMSFGPLVSEWRVFRAPLLIKFSNVGKFIHIAMQLFNWCMPYRLRQDPLDM
uniref:DDE Tnp4 domain-containing protein n=1 Tax=Globisporangium ultimum (strain ATCC 200006 / CBS 805.95 / DAOM BR144) TaxID=431595 RepID=K3XBU7_GLOUD